MPFYFRKSVSAGPFRFNFSKGGVGASVGVKGFRIGTGPRGHYVHAGRGGLYYRASLGGKAKGSSVSTTPRNFVPPPSHPSQQAVGEPDVVMHRVSSADVLEMQDERFGDLLDELNRKQAEASSAWLLGSLGVGAGLLIWAAGGGFWWAAGFLLVGIAIGLWRDTYSRSAVLFYELEDDAQQAYVALTEAFDRAASCNGKWHIDAGGNVETLAAWKRNAGAGRIVARQPTTLTYALRSFLKCNITPPALRVGKETLMFLPDVVLVVEKEKVGAVSYDALNIRYQDSQFIESEAVPADAEVISQTWQHPNKSGGPDRRFKDNRLIPICLYETAHLTSSNGLKELVQFSRTGVTQPLVDAVRFLARSTRTKSAASAMPSLQ